MVPWLIACVVALNAALYPRTTVSDAVAVDIAQSVNEAAHAFPLPGDNGVVETAIELVTLAGVEGHFDPDAVAIDYAGWSASYFQIHVTNAHRLGLTTYDLFDSFKTARAAAFLIVESHRVCSKYPDDYALSMYAVGRGRCTEPQGVKLSRVRMGLAHWLLRTHPVYWVDRR